VASAAVVPLPVASSSEIEEEEEEEDSDILTNDDSEDPCIVFQGVTYRLKEKMEKKFQVPGFSGLTLRLFHDHVEYRREGSTRWRSLNEKDYQALSFYFKYFIYDEAQSFEVSLI